VIFLWLAFLYRICMYIVFWVLSICPSEYSRISPSGILKCNLAASYRDVPRQIALVLLAPFQLRNCSLLLKLQGVELSYFIPISFVNECLNFKTSAKNEVAWIGVEAIIKNCNSFKVYELNTHLICRKKIRLKVF
jgi:hypothetical protein